MTSQSQPTVADIVAASAAHHGLPVHALYSPQRSARLVTARQAAMHVAHSLCGYSLPLIGRVIGGWDHSTIHHGVRAHLTRPGAEQTSRDILDLARTDGCRAGARA